MTGPSSDPRPGAAAGTDPAASYGSDPVLPTEAATPMVGTSPASPYEVGQRGPISDGTDEVLGVATSLPVGAEAQQPPRPAAYTAPQHLTWSAGPDGAPLAPEVATPQPVVEENVTRGLWFAAVAVVIGWVLAATVYAFGHVPSIIALAMPSAGAFMYRSGAGVRATKGAIRLVAVLVVGGLLAWPASLGTQLFAYYVASTGTSTGAFGYVLGELASPSLFMAKIKEFLLVAAFGVVGLVVVCRPMVGRWWRYRRSAAV